ncbi:hypothetical protein LIER_28502 [Lithospermum erythrorhizon]|uniref:Uncharacterized protein n=1 Tax=Lithospermum erythrorhizon TaxID=34254 RepID=A0AAV3RG02_LITER
MTAGSESIIGGLPRMCHLMGWSSILRSHMLDGSSYMPRISCLKDTSLRSPIIIRQEVRLLTILANIGPHWPKIVREFMCNISADIADPDSPMFHQVKLRGRIFNFSPELINKNYGRTNEGITGATLKLADIVGELTGNALTV